METLLEEKSHKSYESGSLSNSSGSGADIEGHGHAAYSNQKKGERATMFCDMQEGGMVSSREHFDEFQDDGSEDEQTRRQMEEAKKKELKRKQVVTDKSD